MNSWVRTATLLGRHFYLYLERFAWLFLKEVKLVIYWSAELSQPRKQTDQLLQLYKTTDHLMFSTVRCNHGQLMLKSPGDSSWQQDIKDKRSVPVTSPKPAIWNDLHLYDHTHTSRLLPFQQTIRQRYQLEGPSDPTGQASEGAGLCRLRTSLHCAHRGECPFGTNINLFIRVWKELPQSMISLKPYVSGLVSWIC